jgi:hypothetical protein
MVLHRKRGNEERMRDREKQLVQWLERGYMMGSRTRSNKYEVFRKLNAFLPKGPKHFHRYNI